jgi:hypothetical protein
MYRLIAESTRIQPPRQNSTGIPPECNNWWSSFRPADSAAATTQTWSIDWNPLAGQPEAHVQLALLTD